MLAPSLQDVPSDSPAARGLPAAEQSPGPLAPTHGSHLPVPTDPPRLHTRPSTRSVAEAGLRAGAARRPAHPTLDRPVGTSRTSPWRARHARSPAGRRLPPGCGRRTPAWTPTSTDQFRLRTPGRGWPAAGHGGPLHRPDIPVQGDRPADRYGTGPDSDGQAADTSTAQRPTMRLASRPRPTTLPAHPGPDRTGRQCACSPSANPAATSAGTHPA